MVEINQFGSPNQPNQQDFGNQNQQTNSQFQSNQAFNQTAQNQTFNQQTNSAKGLFQIPEKFLQLIPWIPIGLEMLTGQKIPATGVLADILSGIQQVQLSMNQVSTQQQQIWNKLVNLENNASQQLTSLSQQVANTKQDFRIFATEKQSFVGDQTKKSLEFQGDRKDLEQARRFIPQSESEYNE